MDIEKKQKVYDQCTDAALVKPSLNSTNFIYSEAAQIGKNDKLIYARQCYPGCFPLEMTVAKLEAAYESLAFCSGMAAATTVFNALEEGDVALVAQELYWPIKLWLQNYAKNQGVKVRWLEHATPEIIEEHLCENTKLIWIEALSNPSLSFTDVSGIADITPSSVFLAVDATCLSPELIKPIVLGADLVMHSASKILSGHSDLLGGVLSVSSDSEFWQRIKCLRWLTGNGLGVQDSTLLLRSIRSLRARVIQSSESALQVASYFRTHPAVEQVIYPGLEEHPNFSLLSSNLTGLGFGPLIGIRVSAAADICSNICEKTQYWQNATGFGSVESLIEHRATAEYKLSQSPDNYLRLSVGLEPVEDLISDLEMAMEQSQLRQVV